MYCSFILSTNRAQHQKDPKRLFFVDISKRFSNWHDRKFPLFRGRRGGCGSSASAWLATLALSTAAEASSAANASEQIARAVDQYWTHTVAATAEQENWHNVRFTHSSAELNSSKSLPACSHTPTVDVDGVASAIAGRHRLTVACSDGSGWQIKVNSQVDLFVSAVFASEIIERGDTLSPSQLKIEELKVGRASRGFFSDVDQVVGKGAKRRIRANQLLSDRLLTQPLLVRRGQRVDIVASKDGITASTQGEAVDEGQEGEVIRVKNLSSEKVIKAKVLDEGTVTSTY